MTSPTNSRTQSFFDRYAGEFNAIYGNRNTATNRVINALFRRSMRTRYEMTIAQAHPIAGRTVLDVGCGPGHYSIELASRGAKAVLGIDFADGMLEIARAAAARAGVSATCEFRRADFHDASLNGPFDFVIVMGFMDYMPDPAATIRRTLSLTRQRAFFSFPLAGGLLAWQRQLRYKNRCDLFLYDREQVERLMAAAGADSPEITVIDRDLFVTAGPSRRSAAKPG
jgi:SAM-dependent methyltransferase